MWVSHKDGLSNVTTESLHWLTIVTYILVDRLASGNDEQVAVVDVIRSAILVIILQDFQGVIDQTQEHRADREDERWGHPHVANQPQEEVVEAESDSGQEAGERLKVLLLLDFSRSLCIIFSPVDILNTDSRKSAPLNHDIGTFAVDLLLVLHCRADYHALNGEFRHVSATLNRLLGWWIIEPDLRLLFRNIEVRSLLLWSEIVRADYKVLVNLLGLSYHRRLENGVVSRRLFILGLERVSGL